ncbi:hypothetical protein LZ31DRAFT_598653 [Colletotrichum somersetense]|nr:hypothetical protein LZ31DRAFT_598653 [Colletotrichum somersetense]
MFPRYYRQFFLGLSALAVLLLWGISLLNGTVAALFKAVGTGELSPLVPLVGDYTGFPLVDYPVSLLVAFFFQGTNGSEEAYQLFLLDAYSTLQPAFVWLYVESLRDDYQSLSLLEQPIVFGILWQCFGGAISLPLYYALHVSRFSDRGRAIGTHQLGQARALPLSFLLGAVVPAVVGMAPTWLGPDARSARQHQVILAAWQPDPVWVSALQMVGSKTASLLWPCRTTADDKRAVRWWILVSYLLSAAVSASGHLYALGRVLSSKNESTNIWRMYMPLPGLLHGPDGLAADVLKRGPWLFLQYDLVIISLSSLVWAYSISSVHNNTFQPVKILTILLGAVAVGPGATVSLILCTRLTSNTVQLSNKTL